MQSDRLSEWFVPKFGSRNFRLAIGILFLPYTGMVMSFAVWGSLSVDFALDRLASVCLLYFFAIGIAAHCIDAIGSSKKPWGTIPHRILWIAATGSLATSFSIGLYYAFLDSWLLFPIGMAEGFFLFAYNLELFQGRFHNNASFVLSWGVLPVFAGAAIQSSHISAETIVSSAVAGLASYVLITTSRKYKALKWRDAEHKAYYKKEIVLKTLSCCVVFWTVLFFVLRYTFNS